MPAGRWSRFPFITITLPNGSITPKALIQLRSPPALGFEALNQAQEGGKSEVVGALLLVFSFLADVYFVLFLSLLSGMF
jgi:hypothetical protein